MVSVVSVQPTPWASEREGMFEVTWSEDEGYQRDEGGTVRDRDGENVRAYSLLNYFSNQKEVEEYVERTRQSRIGSAQPANGVTNSSPITYSTTNNQVEGVDEADIVKTDGRYIYIMSDDSVTILEAFPPENAKMLSQILIWGRPLGLFLNENQLVILEGSAYYSYRGMRMRIAVYDVSTPASPVLKWDFAVSGYYVCSRMIDNYIYLITNHYLQTYEGNLILPSVWSENTSQGLTYSQIRYFKDSESSEHITMIVGFDLMGEDSPSYKALLTGSSHEIYVSEENIYIAEDETSTIHKFSISEGNIRYVCSAKVPGTILNQFSMDVYQGYLRVATTLGSVARGGGTARNNLYILDGNISLVGSLEGLAPGEQIHSARFMGDRGYLVTFKKIDPFFVVDLSNPLAPRVLGYLTIQGFSDYMHPFDENHIIGLGKDTYDMGDFAWFQGLKLSVFDVTDVENPKEISKYIIGDRGTFSEALYDHKAFLYIRSHNLIVLPVLLYEIDYSKYPGGAPPEAYGEPVWEGAYVLSLSL